MSLNTDPMASTGVVVPVKYRWWNVPTMQPDRKMAVANRTALVAEAVLRRPMRVNRKAMTTVAKTSKNPPPRGWTTSHRQYSAMATYQAPLRDLQVHGLALSMVLGVAIRLFPGLFG